uniref:Integrase zinc-binding domain-containing protein n=1 Tax=Strigamia maritima TaxID=126957 RepID=T1IJF4_STRMM
MQYIKQARKIVNKNLKKISAKSKKRFDKNRQEIEFHPGDFVYLKKPNRKVGQEKLLPQYSGPWEIIMNMAPNNYQITNHTRKKIDIVNLERLKKFNKRVDKIIEDMDPPQVHFSPEIEIINEGRNYEINENQETEEITERFIDDNDQIALKPLFEPEEIIDKNKKILKHSYNLRERIRKPPPDVVESIKKNVSVAIHTRCEWPAIVRTLTFFHFLLEIFSRVRLNYYVYETNDDSHGLNISPDSHLFETSGYGACKNIVKVDPNFINEVQPPLELTFADAIRRTHSQEDFYSDKPTTLGLQTHPKYLERSNFPLYTVHVDT